MSKFRPQRIVNIRQPLAGGCDLDPSNFLSRLVKMAMYPTPTGWRFAKTFVASIKPFIEAQEFSFSGAPTIRPTRHGLAVLPVTSAVWSSHTYPAGLRCNQNFTVVQLLTPLVQPWIVTAGPRLIDTGTATSSWWNDVNSVNSTQISMKARSVGDTAGFGTGSITLSTSVQSIVVGTQYRGQTNVIDYYLGTEYDFSPKLIGNDAVSRDSTSTSANCQLEVSTDTTGTVVVSGVFWLAHPSGRILSDYEITSFMANPWQVFMPSVRRRSPTSAAGFHSRYNYDMVGAG